MMKPISVWKQELAGGIHTARLASLYCCSPEQTAAHAARYAAVLDGLEAAFGAHTEAGLYSAPGRTEIGGNHTDHQHGRVLAGSVNIDMIAAAAPNGLNQLRVQSEGYDLCVIDLGDLAARKEEENTTMALLRGECEAFKERGAALSGLDVYISSNVPKGSGVSSSAAFCIFSWTTTPGWMRTPAAATGACTAGYSTRGTYWAGGSCRKGSFMTCSTRRKMSTRGPRPA